MSRLQQDLKSYLTLRRGLGFKLVDDGRKLAGFVRLMERQGRSHVTAQLSLEWAKNPAQALPRTWSSRLGAVRQFARYLHARDPRHEVPSADLAPYRLGPRLKPYLYSEADILALLKAARQVAGGFKGETYATFFGLLAATGIRVGEATALDRSDFDPDRGLLIIRDGKLGKSRQLVLHPTSVQALRRYAQERDRRIARSRSPAFFLSGVGKRLLRQNIHFDFLRMVRAAGLEDRKPHRPRIHDLRHTFTIRVITGWYRSDLPTGPRIPALSTYLGHVSPSSTYWYLQATTDLLEQACRRLESSQAGGER